jgi:hypothetical protein
LIFPSGPTLKIKVGDALVWIVDILVWDNLITLINVDMCGLVQLLNIIGRSSKWRLPPTTL